MRSSAPTCRCWRWRDRLTMTVTPVLADQLEDAGVRERLRQFLVDWRIGAAEADARQVPAECRDACEAELARYRHALELLDGHGGDPLRAFQTAAEEGRVALAASAATHAVLPLLATREGLAAAARRRDPLAPAAVRLGRGVLAARVRLRAGVGVAAGRGGGALVLRRPERARWAARGSCPGRDRGRPGGAADRLGGDRAGSGRSTAIPPTPPTPSSPASRCAGCGSGRSAAAATTRRPRRR